MMNDWIIVEAIRTVIRAPGLFLTYLFVGVALCVALFVAAPR